MKDKMSKEEVANMRGKEKETLQVDNKWEEELIRRIDQIEETADAVQTMTKKDYAVAGVITLLCLLFVVVGAFIH
ncbi:MAG: hypothetical protein E7264_03585 [Lachnospiraceae bacterium]|nr:hypothetical protein [Lachnospiraceae bacterium]